MGLLSLFGGARRRRHHLYEHGDWHDLQVLCQRELEKDPENPHITHDLAIAYWRMKDYEQARDALDRLILLMFGLDYLHDVNLLTEEAISRFNRMLIPGRYLYFLVALGAVLIHEQKDDQAKALLDRLRVLRDNLSEKYVCLVQIALKRQDQNDLQELIDELDARFPGREKAIRQVMSEVEAVDPLNYALVRMTIKRKRRHNELVKELENWRQDAIPKHRFLSAVALMEDDPQESENLLMALIQEFPQETNYLRAMLDFNIRRGQVQEARELLENILDNKDSSVTEVMSGFYRIVDHLDGDEKLVDRILRLNLENHDLDGAWKFFQAIRQRLDSSSVLEEWEEELRALIREREIQELGILTDLEEAADDDLLKVAGQLFRGEVRFSESFHQSQAQPDYDKAGNMYRLGSLLLESSSEKSRGVEILKKVAEASPLLAADAYLKAGTALLEMNNPTEGLKFLRQVDFDRLDISPEEKQRLLGRIKQEDKPPTKPARFSDKVAIGRGGMGQVFKAVDHDLKQMVALKIIHSEHRHDRRTMRRFFREAEVAAGLEHPNIVKVLGWLAEPEPIIIMEYVDGVTLRRLIRKKGAVSPDFVTKIARDVAAGLQAAHDHGIVHRDIKPDNIMITRDRQVKVADFGLARPELGATITRQGFVLGTPTYMSPEQIRGQHVSGASDQYALAVTVYELLTAQPPFNGGDIGFRHVYEDPDPPSTYASHLTPLIDQVILKGLSKNAEARYPSVTAFIEALDHAL